MSSAIPAIANTIARTIVSTLMISIAVLSLSAHGAENMSPDTKQDLDQVKQVAEHFLMKETTGLAGTIKIKMGELDSRLRLANCVALEAFSPSGSRLWGKTTVGVRCTAPQTWTVYIQGSVQVWSDYFITAHTIAQGQLITENDITALKGDLTSLPSGIVTQASQAIGHTSVMALSSGLPLRQEGLKFQQIVLQGQTIRLISNGAGFSVSTEAQALNNASVGQAVKVKTTSGQVLSGIAKAAGLVEIAN